MASRTRKQRGRRKDLAGRSSPDWSHARQPSFYDQGPAPKPKPGPYQYTKVEHAQTVRLLEVVLFQEPARISSNFYTNYYPRETPKCRIRHCELNNQPLYTAVSYTWGSGQELIDLDVDGKILRVRSNVHEMLRRLAKPGQWQTLWIDAICINQDDLQERNAQVRLMGTIFAKANFVLVWLGYDSSLWMVSNIARQELEQYLPGDLDRMVWKFFQHPYWRRRWVIQEVALARSVLLVAPGVDGGLIKLPLTYLDSFYQQIPRFKLSKRSDVYEVHRSPVRQLLKSRQNQRTGNESLRTLLITYRDSLCSDIRDKIFALVSLSETAKVHLEIDYAADPLTILFSVLRYAFAHESLSCGGIVGLLFQLKRQLGVSRTDLLQAYNMHQYRDVIERLKVIAVYNLGYVSNDPVSPRLEACAHKCRDCVGALRGLRTPSLRRYEPHDRINAMKFTGTTQGLLTRTLVSGPDLCVFSFRQRQAIFPTETFQQMGLASSWVEPGDEVWQFPDTPLALVARHEMEDYRIVARALIIMSTKD